MADFNPLREAEKRTGKRFERDSETLQLAYYIAYAYERTKSETPFTNMIFDMLPVETRQGIHDRMVE